MGSLAATLSRILQNPIYVSTKRGRTGGHQLTGINFIISPANPEVETSPVSTTSPEIKAPDEIYSQEFDFANSQTSAILGAIEYRYLSQNRESLVDNIGQQEYETLTEACRQLSLKIRATHPSEYPTSARLQGIDMDQYSNLRTQVLELLKTLRQTQTESLLQALSPDHQQVINWFLSQSNHDFNQLLAQLTDLEESDLKNENNFYANSWQFETKPIPTIDNNADNAKKILLELLTQLQESNPESDSPNKYDIGQIIMKRGSGRILDYTIWSPEDVLKFILRKLPTSERSNFTIIDLHWKMIKEAQNFPNKPRYKLVDRPLLRSIAALDLPNIQIPKKELGFRRLVYRAYTIHDTKLITPEGIFKDQQTYENFIKRG